MYWQRQSGLRGPFDVPFMPGLIPAGRAGQQIAPGCADPCAPCAQGTSLYDAALCGDVGWSDRALAWLNENAGYVLAGAGGLVLLSAAGRRR